MNTLNNEKSVLLLDGMPEEFILRAKLLGHDLGSLKSGREEVRYFTLPDLMSVRRVMSNASDHQRTIRQKTFFNASLKARSRLGQGMHDRGESVVFADGAMPETDSRGLNNHLPVHVKALSVLHKTIRAGEEWDLSVRAEQWGLSYMEELYCTVNIGRLVIEPGGRLVIRGNVFSLLCQEIVLLPGAAQDDYNLGVLPTPFSVDHGIGTHDGQPGHDGGNGKDGLRGTPLDLQLSMLGPLLRGSPRPEQLDGTAGMDGRPGSDGDKGRNGGMSKIAEITLRKVTGELRVYSRSGTGGNGGQGGAGGNGGTGGGGEDGYQGLSGTMRGGQGGAGGAGGDGGNGGHGGHGGLASNIYVSVPEEAVPQVKLESRPSMGGLCGGAGRGGKGGKGGQGGSPDKEPIRGADGGDGQDGQDGRSGVNGRSRPAAVLYLNDQPWNPT